LPSPLGEALAQGRVELGALASETGKCREDVREVVRAEPMGLGDGAVRGRAVGPEILNVGDVQGAGVPPACRKMQACIDAPERHHLSHAHVQMARELGMNPATLGKIDKHRQEPWKQPLPQFIEELYLKRFGKTAPDNVMSIEERVRLENEKKEARRAAKAAKRERAVQT
jgi:hypothetical protein